jgi:hypothetical protein
MPQDADELAQLDPATGPEDSEFVQRQTSGPDNGPLVPFNPRPFDWEEWPDFQLPTFEFPAGDFPDPPLRPGDFFDPNDPLSIPLGPEEVDILINLGPDFLPGGARPRPSWPDIPPDHREFPSPIPEDGEDGGLRELRDFMLGRARRWALECLRDHLRRSGTIPLPRPDDGPPRPPFPSVRPRFDPREPRIDIDRRL